jgi:CheY-like chemotaxis protein
MTLAFKHSAGGFGTLNTLPQDEKRRGGPISLHNAIREKNGPKCVSPTPERSWCCASCVGKLVGGLSFRGVLGHKLMSSTCGQQIEHCSSCGSFGALGEKLEGFTDEVVVARDGVAAIEYLFSPERSTEEMPRLVLLNLKMPRLNGFEVLKKMRADERTRFVPVVMLTSSDPPEDVRRAYELGANGYLD